MANTDRFTPHQLVDSLVFEGLEERVHVALAQASRVIRLEVKAGILSHLHESRDVNFVVSGTVRVNMVAAGGRQIPCQLLPPGEMFGELAAIDGLPRSASVLAEEACVLGRIDLGTFNQLIEDHPSLALAVMRRLVRLSGVLINRVFEYHTYDVGGRIYTDYRRLCCKPVQEGLMANTARFTPHQLGGLLVLEGLEERVLVALAQALRMLRLEVKAEILTHLHESRDVGELAAIDGLPRSASVFAEEACVLGRIDVGTFNQLIQDYPSLALTVMRRLARLSRVLTSRVFEYHTYNVRGRIYTELIRLTERAALESPEPILLTACDMASRVGTTWENVVRICGDLRKNGVIEKSGVRVTDPKALRAMFTACEFG